MKEDSKSIKDLEEILAVCRDNEEKQRCMKAYLSALYIDGHYGPGLDSAIFLLTHPDLTQYLSKQTQELGMEEEYRGMQKKLQDPAALGFIRALETYAEIRADRKKQEKRGESPSGDLPDDQ